MKVLIIAGIIIGVLIIAVTVFLANSSGKKENIVVAPEPTEAVEIKEEFEEITSGLDTPWGIALLPDKTILVTERSGRVRLIASSGKLQYNPVAVIDQAVEIGEGGLLGIALHPNFLGNKYVYLYYTYTVQVNRIRTDIFNRVVRMTYKNNVLTDEKIIVDSIPGSQNHNGGRIAFGPDRFLYITTGDAQAESLSQDPNSLAGKILRVTDEGEPAPGNPYNNLVYSIGHRNPQGLAWDSFRNLWSTEHGRSNPSGYDELNQIFVGGNYGWPDFQGDETNGAIQVPVAHSGPDETWAPAGLAVIGKSLYFGGLRGEALYEAEIEDGKVYVLKEYFKNKFGRIRDVVADSEGMLYISTSNQDGRGTSRPEGDKIMRIDPKILR